MSAETWASLSTFWLLATTHEKCSVGCLLVCFLCVFVFYCSVCSNAAVLIDLVSSEIRQKAKHWAEQPHFNSTFTVGLCARWPLTKGTKAWIKVAKMSFLYWPAELRLRGTVKSLAQSCCCHVALVFVWHLIREEHTTFKISFMSKQPLVVEFCLEGAEEHQYW